MTPPPTPLPPVAESALFRAARAESIKLAWQTGQNPDAAAALRDNPDLAADKAVAIDLAYDEFCTREEAGETLDADEFCARFPFAASLRRLLAVHQFLDEHPDALGTGPASWPAVGDPLGDFVPLRELGRGSFARVYLALESTAGNRPVVLKVSAASREADTLGPLAHAHLIQVLSCRTVEPWTVVAMPFVGTATLEDAIEAVWPPDRAAPPDSAAVLLNATDRGRRPEDPPFPGRPAPLCHPYLDYGDAVARVAVGLFGAVAYLHEQGVVHRDIKPSNVLLAPGCHPFLLDFNLASCGADPWRLVGTLPYMAPEQLALFGAEDGAPGEPPDGRPGDVFACGVVLFELLTGRHPFRARGTGIGTASLDPHRKKTAAVLLAAQSAGHLPFAALNPLVPTHIREAVERCLALDPARRPTAAELVALFAPPPSPPPPPPVVESRRGRGRASVLAGACVSAAALALGYANFRAPAVPAGGEPVAQPEALPATPFERGLLFCKRGEYGLAASEFRTAGREKNDGRAYEYAAFCLSHGIDPLTAIDSATRAIELGHGTASVYANRAYNRYQRGEDQKAKADCDEALRLDPNLRAAHYTRARALLRLHLQAQQNEVPIPTQAVEDIDLVTAAVTDDPEVWNAAAQIYVLACPEKPGKPEMRDRAAKAVLAAVRAGKNPKQIGASAVFAPLVNDPVYKTALALSPGKTVSVANSQIVTPFQ